MRFNEDGTELLGGATFTKFKYDDNKGKSTSLEYYSYDNSNSDTWVIKCTGSNGSDDDKLRELIKKNLNDNHFILSGSGGDGKVIDFYDSQIFYFCSIFWRKSDSIRKYLSGSEAMHWA